MVSERDIDQLNGMLLSEKAKFREEGCKKLNCYLNEDVFSALFVALLNKRTTALKEKDPISTSSWPGVLNSLCICITRELSSHGKKPPKPFFAKILRQFIAKAEEQVVQGGVMLLRKIKTLFQHIHDFLFSVPNYSSDYGFILRQILLKPEYRLKMGKKLYKDFLLGHFDQLKFETKQTGASDGVLSWNNNVVKLSLSLIALFQNTAGDFPPSLYYSTSQFFCDFFSDYRGEGHLARKIVIALNFFLLNFGLNFGSMAKDIHSSFQNFLVRFWSTKDKELKERLILYIRIQTKLQLALDEDSSTFRFLEQIFDLIEQDLNQPVQNFTLIFREVQDERTKSNLALPIHLLEMNAHVIFKMVQKRKSFSKQEKDDRISKKRKKRENPFITLKEKIQNGSFLWHSTFCLLIKNFGQFISVEFIISCAIEFKSNLSKALEEGYSAHSSDNLIWPIRCMEVIACVWKENSFEHEQIWKEVWSLFFYWIPLYMNFPAVVDAMYGALSCILAKNLIKFPLFSFEFWTNFSLESPLSVNLLRCISTVFSSNYKKNDHQLSEEIKIREKLLKYIINSSLFKNFSVSTSPSLSPGNASETLSLLNLIPNCIQSLVLGYILHKPIQKKTSHSVLLVNEIESEPAQPLFPDDMAVYDFLSPNDSGWWLELNDEAKLIDFELSKIDKFETLYSNIDSISHKRNAFEACVLFHSDSRLSFPSSSSLISFSSRLFHDLLNLILEEKNWNHLKISYSFQFLTILSHFIHSLSIAFPLRQVSEDFLPNSKLLQKCPKIFRLCISSLFGASYKTEIHLNNSFKQKDENIERKFSLESSKMSSMDNLALLLLSLSSFISSPSIIYPLDAHGIFFEKSFLPLLQKLLTSAMDDLTSSTKSSAYSDGWEKMVDGMALSEDSHADDMDSLKVEDDELDHSNSEMNRSGPSIFKKNNYFFDMHHKDMFLQKWTSEILANRKNQDDGEVGILFMMQSLLTHHHSFIIKLIQIMGSKIPDESFDALFKLFSEENDLEIKLEYFSAICCLKFKNLNHFPQIASSFEELANIFQKRENYIQKLLYFFSFFFKNYLKISANQISKQPENFDKDLEKSIFQVTKLIEEWVSRDFSFFESRMELVDFIFYFCTLFPSTSEVLLQPFFSFLHDPEYRVRSSMTEKIHIFFENSDSDLLLFQNLCQNFGIEMVSDHPDHMISFDQVKNLTLDPDLTLTLNYLPYCETAFLTLGHVAPFSSFIESRAVFMLCSHASLFPNYRPLIESIIDKIAKSLGYNERFKFMQHQLPFILSSMIQCQCSIESIISIKNLFSCSDDIPEFVNSIVPWLLPLLLFEKQYEKIQNISQILEMPVSELIKQNFSCIFATLLPFHFCPNEKQKENANAVLQGTMLEMAKINESKRDKLIQKNMVNIVCFLLQLTSPHDISFFPFHPKNIIFETIKIVVDGFANENLKSADSPLTDKLNIFKPDHIFQIFLQIHCRLGNSMHHHHKCICFSSLEVIVKLLDEKINSPANLQYLLTILLKYIHENELKNQILFLLNHVICIVLKSFDHSSIFAFGEMLEIIIYKLLQVIIGDVKKMGNEKFEYLIPNFSSLNETSDVKNTFDNYEYEKKSIKIIFEILDKLVLNSPNSLHPFIKNLELFPNLKPFEQLRKFQIFLRVDFSLKEEIMLFSQGVSRMPSEIIIYKMNRLLHELWEKKTEVLNLLSPSLSKPAVDLVDMAINFGSEGTNIFKSKQINQNQNEKRKENELNEFFDPTFISAVWNLVEICTQQKNFELHEIAARFLSLVGVWEVDSVVFRLPAEFEKSNLQSNSNLQSTSAKLSRDEIVDLSSGNHSFLLSLFPILKNLLGDKSPAIVQLASQTLKGLLATESGHAAYQTLSPNEHSYLSIFSNGNNEKKVEQIFNIFRKQDHISEKKSIYKFNDWMSCDQSYDEWICDVVIVLIPYSNSIVFRLCEPIARFQPKISSLIFPFLLSNLSLIIFDKSEENICDLLSEQITKHVFCDDNTNIRCIQTVINALNALRCCHVLARMNKYMNKSSKNQESELVANDPADWEFVYWLNIDYLTTAKAALKCHAVFTSHLYVEQWCEKQFGFPSLGKTSFSDDNSIPLQDEILLNAFSAINEPDGIYGVARMNKIISRLALYNHEHRWSESIQTHDILLRTPETSLHFPNESQLQFFKNKSSSSKGSQMLEKETEKSIQKSNQKSNQMILEKGLIFSLKRMGCLHLADKYMKSMTLNENTNSFMNYDCAFELGFWDMETSLCNYSDSSSMDNDLIMKTFMNGLIDGDSECFFSKISFFRKNIVESLSLFSAESSKNVFPSIVNLQVLDHLEEGWNARWQKNNLNSNLNSNSNSKQSLEPCIPSDDQVLGMESAWNFHISQFQNHFELQKLFFEWRKKMFQILERRDRLPFFLFQTSTLARKCGNLNQSENAIHELKLISQNFFKSNNSMASEDSKLFLSLSPIFLLGRVEEAKLFSAKGQKTTAIQLLQYLLEQNDESISLQRWNAHSEGKRNAVRVNLDHESISILCLTAKWLAETRSVSSRTILEKYLEKAVQLIEVTSANEVTKCRDNFATYLNEVYRMKTFSQQKCQVHYQFAQYVDNLFQNLENRLTSPEAMAAQKLRAHRMKELDMIKKKIKTMAKMEDVRNFHIKANDLEKTLNLDQEEALRLQQDRTKFLLLAFQNYRICLSCGEKYDLKVIFRMISMWFNSNQMQEVNKEMYQTIMQVNTYKFVPLIYQIASRMSYIGNENKQDFNFQKVLSQLVVRMMNDHPYHTLYQILALSNGDRVKGNQRHKNLFVVDIEKKKAAENILKLVSKKNQPVLSQMKQLVEVYIKIAELETTKEEINKQKSLPRNLKSLKHLHLVPVITAKFPIDRSCAYPPQNFPSFSSMGDKITVMNGINAPKVVECLDSFGNKYRQLAKSGNDDLRQDAVMEQLFGLVNSLLYENRSTRKRKLKIRTYKVVPFTPSAGVLEWIDGTIPLGEYLLGSTRDKGAHRRYGYKDWTFMKCREFMTVEKDKRKAFETVCMNFKPVMRYFFLENFLKPSDWFEKKLNYTRSVAASSMVGYIIGLGDRHSMNILMDQKSAEAIHIDLGIAFEQGVMLKTPERVPFRLTRDIVDGFGICGIEGVFRRCCEATMDVLKENKQALLTIIEVFIYDPLYKWALLPLKALKRQEEAFMDEDEEVNADDEFMGMEDVLGDEKEGNKDATRALLRVKQKLDGYEEGELCTAQGQVQQLIQQAQDNDRLCTMFPGWAAWL